jgi:hypothetical protein
MYLNVIARSRNFPVNLTQNHICFILCVTLILTRAWMVSMFTLLRGVVGLDEWVYIPIAKLVVN